MRAWVAGCILVGTALLALFAPAGAQTTGNARVTWYTSAIVQVALTPNYAAGYGTVKAVFGAQPAPSPGAGACLQACAVDFGVVQSGSQYLYKYAAHLNVHTNDSSGFNVYGEGAADFNDGAGHTMPLGQTLYYVGSSAGGDTNTGFSPGFPFSVTTGTVTPPTPSISTPPSIAYSVYPSPMYASSAPDADIYQDYEMKVPATASASNYFVWIVYTVVAS